MLCVTMLGVNKPERMLVHFLSMYTQEYYIIILLNMYILTIRINNGHSADVLEENITPTRKSGRWN